MKKIFRITLLLVLLGLTYTAAAAARPTKNSFTLPEQAKKVSPGVYYLGEVPYKGRVAEGYAFVDYGRGYGKPGGSCNNDGKCQGWEDKATCGDCTGGGGEEPDTSSCYGFLSNGAKWKGEPEPYIVNPTNTRGLLSGFVSSNLASNIDKWEAAAGADILGSGSLTSDPIEADTSSPDEQNEVYFADIAEPEAIGVTVVWGIFRGHPAWREILEWDQIYDDVDYDWSDDCLSEDCTSEGSKKMDFENIATHELGHSVGLADLYEAKCLEQTMYGYATSGETKKRSLEAGDIRGVTELYK